MNITHYDLFAGIGGFSLALEEVFTDATIRHIFCEWESFPASVLKRHWPDGEFYGDIADLVTHTKDQRVEGSSRSEQVDSEHNGRNQLVTDPQHKGLERGSHQGSGHAGQLSGKRPDQAPDGFTIVTGGFPCQPFSHAGRRKGTADDRYQWPNMYQVIRNTKPEWVIAENVRGLVTWNDGLVLETVCADLESEGYEVQPFIIPAVAVGAPHRRDRVWIIAHRNGEQNNAERQESRGLSGQAGQSVDVGNKTARPTDGQHGDNQHERRGKTDPDANSLPVVGRTGSGDIHAADAGTAGTDENSGQRGLGESGVRPEYESVYSGCERAYPDWSRNWQEIAFATCDDTVDDGLSRLVDGVPMSRSKWRQNSLKAYGNGIVSQVAMEIMRGIKASV